MKKYALLLAAATIAFIFSSCKSLDPVPVAPAEDVEAIADEVQEQTEDVRPPVVEPLQVLPGKHVVSESYNLTQGLTAFSLAFFDVLKDEHQEQNLAFSPLSLNMALAAIYSGAAGETRKEMASLLGFDKDAKAFNAAYPAYFSALMELTADTLAEVNLANRVFLEESYPVLDSFIQDITALHGGAFEKLDFIRQPRQAESRINHWVEEMTRGRIQDLIPSGTFNELTRLVLTNAVYVKSSWRFPFEEQATMEKEFTTVNGEKKDRDFMIQTQKGIMYAELEGNTIIELPYTSPNLSMLLILPGDENLAHPAPGIPNATEYFQMLAALRAEEVHMEIPKFTLNSEFSLSENLKDMGMQEAFDNRADFSGISGRTDLEISDVLQKVFFEIDEEGSEAAAATAIVVVTTSFDPNMELKQPKMFIANRPFLFVLKENFYDTPLFIGQYVK